MYIRDAIETLAEAGEPVKDLAYRKQPFTLQKCIRYENCIIYVYKHDKDDRILHLKQNLYVEGKLPTPLKQTNINGIPLTDFFRYYNNIKSMIYQQFTVIETWNSRTPIPIQEISNRHLTKLRDKGYIK